MNPRVLIIGVGNQDRGDDAVGLIVAGALAARMGRTVQVGSGDALLWRVLDGNQTADLLIIVDAAEESSGLSAGDWCRIRFPQQSASIERSRLRDTHRLNVDLILRLGQELGTLPAEVWIYALAGRSFVVGEPLSAPIVRAIPKLEETIEAAVHTWLETRPPSRLQQGEVQYA